MSIWANVAPKQETQIRPVEDVVIVGSGPAGYTAALYAARAKREPLVLEGLSPGGLLQNTDVVENFPGYPKGVLGAALIADLREQAARFGARFVPWQADRLELEGETKRVHAGERTIAARALILAMGAGPRTLGVPGEDSFGGGKGIAYCAVCEAPLYEGKATLVVGGGDSAMEEALGLARHARSVLVIHRRRTFGASPILRERVLTNAKVRVLQPWVVESFVGEGKLERALLRHAEDGSVREVAVDGAFVAIGHEPRSSLVRGLVETDARGYVVCRPGTRETSAPGIFACGDLVDSRYRQAVTAAGSGCEAALDAQRWLETHEGATR